MTSLLAGVVDVVFVDAIVHVAEQTKEMEDCLAWSGLRPVEWLLENQPIGQRWCLVHATHMTLTEIRAPAASGAVIGLCPITEANLGDGILAARAFREEGGRFGVGSDSNIFISLVEELRLLEYGQRLNERTRAALTAPNGSTGQALYETAVQGGAQALDQACGGIAAGARADGTSTPKADPSGDYAWEAFRKAATLRPGSGERLEKGADTRWRAGVGGIARRHYRVRVAPVRSRADLFLTYSTNARAAVPELPGGTSYRPISPPAPNMG